jgi:hypothetical protein
MIFLRSFLSLDKVERLLLALLPVLVLCGFLLGVVGPPSAQTALLPQYTNTDCVFGSSFNDALEAGCDRPWTAGVRWSYR